MLKRVVHRGKVLLHDRLALLQVAVADRVLDGCNGLFMRQNARDVKKAGLHDGVDTDTHAGLAGYLIRINDIQFQMLVNDNLLHFARQVIPHIVGAEGAVEQERCARRGLLQYIVALQEIELVAGNEISAGDQEGHVNGLRAKTQVGDRHRARFLGIVDKVTLRVVVGLSANDLDAVVIGAHRSIGAQSIEQAAHDTGWFQIEGWVNLQAGLSHIVGNANGEMVLGCGLVQLIIDSLDLRRGKFLAAQAVAPTDDLDEAARFEQRGDHILVQRFTSAARLLGAVEHGNGFDSSWQRRHKIERTERPEQAHFENAQLGPAAVQVSGCSFRRLAARTHDHDHFLRVRRAHIIEQMVLTPGQLCEPIHRLLDDGRRRLHVGIDRFTTLEVDIGVLRGAAHEGMVRVEAASAVRRDQRVINHGADVVRVQHFDLGHFMAGAEAIEEMDERHPGFQRGGMGNQRHVHDFLSGPAAQQGPAGGARRHDVAVIAENGKPLRSQRTRGHMKYRGGQFPSNLVHVGDHQKKALRGRKGGRQRACL